MARGYRLEEFIPTQPDRVARETLAALKETKHQDTISALATCLLEHLLEHEFSLFDLIDSRVAAGDMQLLYVCSKFPNAGTPGIRTSAMPIALKAVLELDPEDSKRSIKQDGVVQSVRLNIQDYFTVCMSGFRYADDPWNRRRRCS